MSAGALVIHRVTARSARATLDTSVLASGFVGRYVEISPPGALLRAWRNGLFELALSDFVLTELKRTLGQPHLRQRLSDQDIADALTLIDREATIVPITARVVGVATHPEDDLIPATAVSAHAGYLVTDDMKLAARVPVYDGVRLLSPRDFLSIPPLS